MRLLHELQIIVLACFCFSAGAALILGRRSARSLVDSWQNRNFLMASASTYELIFVVYGVASIVVGILLIFLTKSLMMIWGAMDVREYLLDAGFGDCWMGALFFGWTRRWNKQPRNDDLSPSRLPDDNDLTQAFQFVRITGYLPMIALGAFHLYLRFLANGAGF